MESLCPTCGHPREGVPAPDNARRQRKGQPLLRPVCSTAADLGFGDVYECGCAEPCHSERLVEDFRPV